MIVGVDEVGRGCWAGPVCVAAVVMSDQLEGIVDDSKKLSAGQRQIIAQLVKEQSAVALGWTAPSVIDKLGMTAALRLAALAAIRQIEGDIKQILLDGNSNYIGDPRVSTIIGGDGVEPVIAAASVVAKTARDNYMQVMGQVRYLGYGFESHVGYGTAMHKAALSSLGPCDIHRMSFAPLKGYA